MGKNSENVVATLPHSSLGSRCGFNEEVKRKFNQLLPKAIR